MINSLQETIKRKTDENMKQNEPDDYIEIFEDFVKRFEIYYGNKKARPKKNSNEENLN